MMLVTNIHCHGVSPAPTDAPFSISATTRHLLLFIIARTFSVLDVRTFGQCFITCIHTPLPCFCEDPFGPGGKHLNICVSSHEVHALCPASGSAIIDIGALASTSTQNWATIAVGPSRASPWSSHHREITRNSEDLFEQDMDVEALDGHQRSLRPFHQPIRIRALTH